MIILFLLQLDGFQLVFVSVFVLIFIINEFSKKNVSLSIVAVLVIILLADVARVGS